MYTKTIQQKRIEKLVYTQTPIDTIKTVYEGRDFIEVQGSAGKDNLIYRFYNNGTVVEK